MGNAAAGCQGAAEQNASRTPGGKLVLAVVRTAKWGMGSEEDVWQVEVLGTDTVHGLKAKIQELYDVPSQMQRLSLGNSDSDLALEDATQAETLAGKRIYLNPVSIGEMLGGLGATPEAQAAVANMTEALAGAAREAEETEKALRASLQGVKYKVNFERPQEAGGRAAGSKIQLEFDALTKMDDVKHAVETKMFGSVGAEQAFLTFQGMPLPPPITLYQAGLTDGQTVVVSKDRPQFPGEQLMDMMMGAARQAQGGEQNMQDVKYKLSFERPQDAGGKAAGARILMEFDALAKVDEVQSAVEAKMFGSVGIEPAFLTFKGMPLPPFFTLSQAGLTNGDTVSVLKDRPQMPGQHLMDMVMGVAREAQEADQAMQESLQGVKYKVNFERPREAGGKAGGAKIQMEFDALAKVEDVQRAVETKMFGSVGAEPAFLMFQGMPLPPPMTLFHAGIEDGKVVVVSKERPQFPGEQLLSMMMAAAGNGMTLPPNTPTVAA